MKSMLDLRHEYLCSCQDYKGMLLEKKKKKKRKKTMEATKQISVLFAGLAVQEL
ncbi:hypothetical protein AXF42_Ash006458 [Apostasia shenzhenica]|uniref:Uncharacterized protein n=1 Tax=Apostasia shenzhenica TaxID=1088818 RepID=A0A2I0AZ61_9ASPA|nr:hypothetical protein AXF42_Ash006458 [Apostasia shenzhenica]